MMVLMVSVSFAANVGIKGGYNAGTGDFSGYVFGADVKFGVGPILLTPEFLYFGRTGDLGYGEIDQTVMAFNVNAIFKIPMVGLYGGAGLGYYSGKTSFGPVESTSADFGFQIFAGYEISMPGLAPFIEARYTTVDSNSTVDIMGGVNIGF